MVTQLLTDADIQALRYLASSVLDATDEWIHSNELSSNWGIQGDSEAVEETIRDVLRDLWDGILQEEELGGRLESLVSELAPRASKDDEAVRGILVQQLNNFVVECGRDPGPEVVLDYEPRLDWDIRFDERYFLGTVKEIARLLSLEFLDRVIKARVGCLGCRFDSDFELSISTTYDAATNQFVISFPEDCIVESAAVQANETFRLLSNVIRLIYGLRFGLAEAYVLLPISKGGEQQKLGRIDNFLFSRNETVLSRLPITSCWPFIESRTFANDRTLEVLLTRIRELVPSSRPDDYLINLITCFEILFSDGSSEIRYKLAIRSSVLMGLLGSPGAYLILLQAYKDRNELVHGLIGPTETKLEEMRNYLPALERLLSLSTLAYILGGNKKARFLEMLDLVVQSLVDGKSLAEHDETEIEKFREKLRPLQEPHGKKAVV